MTLVLRGITLNEEPISLPLIGRFDERGGTLGRSDDATLTLPDPERMISRLQAHVLHRDEHYWIENVSTASPILHNGRPLSTGMRVILREGDEVRIGGYALQVAFEDDDTSATILRGRTVVPGLKGAVPAPKIVAPQTPGALRAPPSYAAPRDTPPPATPRETPPLAAPRGVAHSTPRDTPGSPREFASTLAEPIEPVSTPAAPAGSPAAGHSLQPRRAQTDMTGESMWRDFQEGAAIDLSLPEGPSPKLMRLIGEMLQVAVEGIQRLVSMRARAKDEMRAEMTMLQVRDNNPLKFSPEAGLALEMLLKPAGRGFLEGPAALRDALTDLQSHQVGMTAAMRSVLQAVLERLDPAKIEALPIKRSVFDRLSRAHRQSRLWETYLKQYRSLSEETQDNFQRFFGDALRGAYEAQVRSLETDPNLTGPSGRGAVR